MHRRVGRERPTLPAWGFNGSGPQPTPTSQIARPSVAKDRRSREAARIVALANWWLRWLATGGGRGGKVGRQAQLRPQSCKRVGSLNRDSLWKMPGWLRVKQDRQHLPGQPQWAPGHCGPRIGGRHMYLCRRLSGNMQHSVCHSHQCAAAAWLGLAGSTQLPPPSAGRQRSQGGSSRKPQAFEEGMQYAHLTALHSSSSGFHNCSQQGAAAHPAWHVPVRLPISGRRFAGRRPQPPAWLTSSCLQKALAGVDRTLAAKLIVCCTPWRPRRSGP